MPIVARFSLTCIDATVVAADAVAEGAVSAPRSMRTRFTAPPIEVFVRRWENISSMFDFIDARHTKDRAAEGHLPLPLGHPIHGPDTTMGNLARGSVPACEDFCCSRR